MVDLTTRWLLRGAIVAVTALACGAASAQTAPSLDHFQCWGISQKRPFEKIRVQLRNELESTFTVVVRPFSICNPADKNDEGISDRTAHLTCYKIEDIEGTGYDGTTVTTVNQFGTETLDLGIGRQLCVPSEKDGVPSELRLDHFKCYEAATTPGSPKFEPRDVSIVDQFYAREATVKRPERFCIPTDKNGEGILQPERTLECYDVSSADAPVLERSVQVVNQFGKQEYIVKKPLSLCVPNSQGPDPECAGQTCGTFTSCNPGSDCSDPVCGSVAEGGGLCVDGATQCAGLTDCLTTADCSDGALCIVESCCGRPVCVPPSAFCPNVTARSSAARAAASSSGPTIGSE